MLKLANIVTLIGLKIGYFLLALIILRILRQFITHPAIANHPQKYWRFFLFYKNINFLFIIGFAWFVLKWPVWIWLQLSMELIPSLLIDDLINLAILAGFILFFLRQSFLIDQKVKMIRSDFTSYLQQYGYYWLFVLNIIVFARIDYFYLALVPGNLSWVHQTMIELSVVVFFIALQLLVLYVRSLKMLKAGPELQAMVNEVASRFKIKVKNVKVWKLERVNNAFSTGLFFRSIFITENLLNIASPEDLRMILGHECAHFKRRHLEVRVLAIGLLIFGGSILIEEYPDLQWSVYVAFGVVSFLMFKVVSRFQELKADRMAAELLGGPEKMAEALIRVFGFNSTPGKFGIVTRLLVGHPDLETRVNRLRGKGKGD